MEKLLLTPEEAARAIGVGRSKLYELMAARAIESIRVGGSRRVPVDALHEYVARLRAEALSPWRDWTSRVRRGIDPHPPRRSLGSGGRPGLGAGQAPP